MENLDSKKKQILDELYTFHRMGIKPGLKRTQLLLEFCGNPHSKLKYIHVAGTNGKGSICSMTASILMSQGYKTGLYTSPHLVTFNERVRIDGAKIPDDALVEILEELIPKAKELGCTFFEITTVLALMWFAKNKVDFAVIETGMGGRFDSTNVLYPVLCIITQIDFDHKDYLGNNLREISEEKAGIIKPAVPVIVADTHQELRDIFIKKAEEQEAPIFFSSDWYSVKDIIYNQDFSMQLTISDGHKVYEDLVLEKSGNHQINNLKAVLSAVNFLRRKFEISDEAVYQGLKSIKKNTGLFARMEIIKDDPMLILDVAHNPGSVKAMTNTLGNSGYICQFYNVVFGVLADKEIDKMLEYLKPYTRTLIVTKPINERASSVQEIARIAEANGFNDIEEIENISEAINYAMLLEQQFLIVGSFYTAGEAVKYLQSINLISEDIL